MIPLIGDVCGSCILDFVCSSCSCIVPYPISDRPFLRDFCVFCLREILLRTAFPKFETKDHPCIFSAHSEKRQMTNAGYGMVCSECYPEMVETIRGYLMDVPAKVMSLQN